MAEVLEHDSSVDIETDLMQVRIKPVEYEGFDAEYFEKWVTDVRQGIRDEMAVIVKGNIT